MNLCYFFVFFAFIVLTVESNRKCLESIRKLNINEVMECFPMWLSDPSQYQGRLSAFITEYQKPQSGLSQEAAEFQKMFLNSVKKYSSFDIDG